MSKPGHSNQKSKLFIGSYVFLSANSIRECIGAQTGLVTANSGWCVARVRAVLDSKKQPTKEVSQLDAIVECVVDADWWKPANFSSLLSKGLECERFSQPIKVQLLRSKIQWVVPWGAQSNGCTAHIPVQDFSLLSPSDIHCANVGFFVAQCWGRALMMMARQIVDVSTPTPAMTRSNLDTCSSSDLSKSEEGYEHFRYGLKGTELGIAVAVLHVGHRNMIVCMCRSSNLQWLMHVRQYYSPKILLEQNPTEPLKKMVITGHNEHLDRLLQKSYLCTVTQHCMHLSVAYGRAPPSDTVTQQNISPLPAHVYFAQRTFPSWVSETASNNRIPTRVVFVRGASGSGKSAMVSTLLQYARVAHTTIFRSQTSAASPIRRNPTCSVHPTNALQAMYIILEAFGKCSTHCNSNRSGCMFAFTIETCGPFAEVVRVIPECLFLDGRHVYQVRDPGERLFHVFYLLSHSAEAERYGIRDPAEYGVMWQGVDESNCSLETCYDTPHEFALVNNCLRVLAFTEEEIHRIWCIISAILNLSNVSFVPSRPNHSTPSPLNSPKMLTRRFQRNLLDPSSVIYLQRVCRLLEIAHVDVFLDALLNFDHESVVETATHPTEDIQRFLRARLDALGVLLYHALVQWITRRCTVTDLHPIAPVSPKLGPKRAAQWTEAPSLAMSAPSLPFAGMERTVLIDTMTPNDPSTNSAHASHEQHDPLYRWKADEEEERCIRFVNNFLWCEGVLKFQSSRKLPGALSRVCNPSSLDDLMLKARHSDLQCELFELQRHWVPVEREFTKAAREGANLGTETPLNAQSEGQYQSREATNITVAARALWLCVLNATSESFREILTAWEQPDEEHPTSPMLKRPSGLDGNRSYDSFRGVFSDGNIGSCLGCSHTAHVSHFVHRGIPFLQQILNQPLDVNWVECVGVDSDRSEQSIASAQPPAPSTRVDLQQDVSLSGTSFPSGSYRLGARSTRRVMHQMHTTLPRLDLPHLDEIAWSARTSQCFLQHYRSIPVTHFEALFMRPPILRYMIQSLRCEGHSSLDAGVKLASPSVQSCTPTGSGTFTIEMPEANHLCREQHVEILVRRLEAAFARMSLEGCTRKQKVNVFGEVVPRIRNADTYGADTPKNVDHSAERGILKNMKCMREWLDYWVLRYNLFTGSQTSDGTSTVKRDHSSPTPSNRETKEPNTPCSLDSFVLDEGRVYITPVAFSLLVHVRRLSQYQSLLLIERFFRLFALQRRVCIDLQKSAGTPIDPHPDVLQAVRRSAMLWVRTWMQYQSEAKSLAMNQEEKRRSMHRSFRQGLDSRVLLAARRRQAPPRQRPPVLSKPPQRGSPTSSPRSAVAHSPHGTPLHPLEARRSLGAKGTSNLRLRRAHSSTATNGHSTRLLDFSSRTKKVLAENVRCLNAAVYERSLSVPTAQANRFVAVNPSDTHSVPKMPNRGSPSHSPPSPGSRRRNESPQSSRMGQRRPCINGDTMSSAPPPYVQSSNSHHTVSPSNRSHESPLDSHLLQGKLLKLHQTISLVREMERQNFISTLRHLRTKKRGTPEPKTGGAKLERER